MKALLLNDCSAYHVGSSAVAENLRRLASEVGLDLEAYTEGAAAAEGQLVLINGEGTLHHDAPRASELHRTACDLRKAGCRIILVNASVQDLTVDLSVFERIVARERRSEVYVRERYAGPVSVIPDLAFCHPLPVTERVERSGLLFVDSVSPRETRLLRETADAMGAPVLSLCQWRRGVGALLSLMRTKEAVVTGRFHGAVFAMLTGTPFIGTPSNTWKTLGMMEDFGLADSYCRRPQILREVLAARRYAVADPAKVQGVGSLWRDFFRGLVSDRASMPRQSIRGGGAGHQLAERGGCPVSPQAACVLVGNGPSVNASGLGKVIDAFDEVIRFNNYRLSGFECHAGSRTSLWSTFGHGMLPKDSAPPSRILFIHGKSGRPASDGEVWRIPHAFYVELRQRIRSMSTFPDTSRVSPSSGCLVAHWLLANGVKRLHLIGFDHFSKKHTSHHHYWQAKAFGRPKDHDGDVEAALFAELREQRRIAYL